MEKIIDKIKIGRTVYFLISMFVSMDSEMLYVGTFQKDGIWCHKIIGRREDGKWYIRS